MVALQDGDRSTVYDVQEDTAFYDSAEDTVDDFDVVASSTAGYSTFVDYYYGYQVDFPDSWTLDPAYDFTSFSSAYESYDDYLLENFNMGIEDLSAYPGITLQEYADSARTYIGTDASYAFESEGSQMFGEYEGMYFLGTYELGSGEKAGVKSYFTVIGSQAYVLTYMYEIPEKDMYQSVIEHVLSSFTVFDADTTSDSSVDAVQSAGSGSKDDFGFASLLHLSAENL